MSYSNGQVHIIIAPALKFTLYLHKMILLIHEKQPIINYVFVFMLIVPVNCYGHVAMVSSPNRTFSWESLTKRLTSSSCTYFHLILTKTLEGMMMIVEIIPEDDLNDYSNAHANVTRRHKFVNTVQNLTSLHNVAFHWLTNGFMQPASGFI